MTIKFTVIEDPHFQINGIKFEKGNTYSAELHNLTEDDIKIAWAAGWCSVDGWSEPPAREPGSKRIDPDSITVTMVAKK